LVDWNSNEWFRVNLWGTKTVGVFKILFLLGLSPFLYADDFDYRKEMDVLKTRIEQLEEKKGENPNATVSFHGVMVGNFQAVSSGDTQAPSVNESRGTFVFQPTVSVVPSEHNEFFF
jgi:hypothetical protein